MTNVAEPIKKKRVSWTERVALIEKQFPDSIRLDWHEAFKDIELFGRIWRDIAKVDPDAPGRSGPRPALDKRQAMERYRQLSGADFTEYPFHEAFQILRREKSVRVLSEMTTIDRNMIGKLLSGTRHPEIWMIEQVAKAFKKKPSYFLEYRVAYILGAMGERITSNPEMSVDLYRKIIRGTHGGN